jgi:hypothetical protein
MLIILAAYIPGWHFILFKGTINFSCAMFREIQMFMCTGKELLK